MPWVELKQDFEGHKAGETIKVKKKEAKDLIQKVYAVEAKSPERDLISKAVKALQGSIGKDVAESTDKAIKQLLEATDKAKKVYAPAFLPDALSAAAQSQIGRIRQENPNSAYIGANYVAQPPDAQGKSMGDWLIQVREAGNGSIEARKKLFDTYGSKMCDEHGEVIVKAPLAEASGLTGGYTVPTEYSMILQTIAVQDEIVYPRARKIPMGARSILVPTLDLTTLQSSGTTPFLGGIVMNWTEEAQLRVETEPQFRQVELVAHELGGYTLASNTVLADNAVALDALLTPLFGKATGWYRDYAFLQGTGSGKPLGVLNAPATIVVNRQAPNRFVLADAATMLSKLLLGSMTSAVWVMSQSVIPQLVQMTDPAGRVIWIPTAGSQTTGGAGVTIPASLLGLPIIYTEKLPALGSKGDVMLLDLSAYLIGDRMQIEVASSIHFKFTNNQTTWRVISRVDGQPWLDNSIRLADASTTVSPFVALQ